MRAIPWSHIAPGPQQYKVVRIVLLPTCDGRVVAVLGSLKATPPPLAIVKSAGF